MIEQSGKPERHLGQAKWLILSLAGNLFLAGVLIGAWFSGPNFRGLPPRPPFQMMVAEAAGKVSPAGLKKLSSLAGDLEKQFLAGMSKTVDLRENIRQQLLNEPFDPARFEKALDALHATFSADRLAGNHAFATTLATMSPADRKQLATIRFP